MRRIHVHLTAILFLALATVMVRAETFDLADGTTVAGAIVYPANADGLNLRVAADKYQRIPWNNFSQAALQQLAKDPKLAQYVDSFIERPDEQAEKIDVQIKPVDRLARPTKESVIKALFHTPVGLVALLIIYAGSLFAAYEISVVRAYPAILVCGISAVAPVVGQIVFLCMPTRMMSPEDIVAEQAAVHAQAQAQAQAEIQRASSFHTGRGEAAEANVGGARLAAREAAPSEEGAIPETQVFARGQFTFNRRFFETKFPGFFGVVRRDAEKHMVLIIKSARGEYEAHRITRIAASDLHLDVRSGGASQEITVPFSEIQEVQLKHKDA